MTFCSPGAVRALADSPHYPFVDSPQTRAATCASGHREPLRPARPLDSGPAVRSIGRRFQPGAHPEGYAVAAMSPLPLRRRPSTVSTVALPLPRCPSKPVW
jgi:hypothetical protein